MLSEGSSATDSFHMTSPVGTGNEDAQSVRSVQSLDSSLASSVSSAVHVDIASNDSPAMIPQIQENEPIGNELVPSYVDIEGELHRQRELVSELKSQLHDVANERDQVGREKFL